MLDRGDFAATEPDVALDLWPLMKRLVAGLYQSQLGRRKSCIICIPAPNAVEGPVCTCKGGK